LDDTDWKSSIEYLKPVMLKYSGKSPVYVYLKRSKKLFVAEKSLWVNICDELVDSIKEKIGEENVRAE
jgi:hypothetical protein